MHESDYQLAIRELAATSRETFRRRQTPDEDRVDVVCQVVATQPWLWIDRALQVRTISGEEEAFNAVVSAVLAELKSPTPLPPRRGLAVQAARQQRRAPSGGGQLSLAFK